jgi:hypothetical protein
MKLKEKIRVGSKVTRKYGEPKTPYMRILEPGFLDESQKKELKNMFESLNPVAIQRNIQRIQDKLYKCVRQKTGAKKAV